MVQLTFIGHSDSNHSAFYLYGTNSADLKSTPCHAHACLFKGCG